MYGKQDVIDFINRFTGGGGRGEVIETFSRGCCYWFAHILHSRFPRSEIRYDPAWNHFTCFINGRLYDITGEVTGKYDAVSFDAYPDPYEKQRIIAQCIEFLEDNDG